MYMIFATKTLEHLSQQVVNIAILLVLTDDEASRVNRFPRVW